jgi:DNA repair exonuclease SbcCD ATPase subunit
MKIDSTLSDILSDDGIKTYFFEQLLPQLNSQVNKYINAFGLQVTLEFDKSLEAKIQQGKYECEYMGFSNGERARIDMAILLSFFDISRNISNWSCNVLFIDEVMDNGVDSDGIESFISTLYNVVTGNSNKHDIGIYLISHKLTNTDVAWDSVVDIVKTNRFSELKVKNNNESSTN